MGNMEPETEMVRQVCSRCFTDNGKCMALGASCTVGHLQSKAELDEEGKLYLRIIPEGKPLEQ